MLIINESFNGNFIENPYVIGTSDVSEYFPIINYNTKERIELGEDFINLYCKPLRNAHSTKFNRSSVIDALNSAQYIKRIYFSKVGEENTIIYVGKGYIVDENDNILLMLASKVPYFKLKHRFDYYFTETQALFIKEKMVLLLSTELITNKKYAVLYKFLQKDYIEDAYKMDLDVIYTTSEKIEKKCYSNTFSLEFNRVEQLTNHVNNVVPQILYKEDAYFHTVNPGLRKEEIITEEERNSLIRDVLSIDVDDFPSDMAIERLHNLLSQTPISFENGSSISNSELNILTEQPLVASDYVYEREHRNSYTEEFDSRPSIGATRGARPLSFELVDDTESEERPYGDESGDGEISQAIDDISF